MKSVRILLLTLLAAFLLGGAASAAGEILNPSPYRAQIDRYDEIYERIYDAAASGRESVSLDQFRVAEEDIVTIYSDLVLSAPELFYLSPRLAVDYYFGIFGHRYATRVFFTYSEDAQSREAESILFDNEIARIDSLVGHSLSEPEKALFVHDYLISIYSYDETGEIHDAATLLRTREGVCQAYSLAYAAILQELGMEAVVVPCPDMNHAWNQVRIDGVWYHVDLVYDDPRFDRIGRVLHDFFLLSDEEMRAAGRSGWRSILECPSSCTDGLSKTARKTSARMIPVGGRWYFIDSSSPILSSCLPDGSDLRAHFTSSQRWNKANTNGHYWVGVFTGLSDYNGLLFFNDPDELLAFDPGTEAVSVLLRTEEEGLSVFGSAIVKDAVEYLLADTPNAGGFSRIHSLDLSGVSTPAALPFTDVYPVDPWYDAVAFVYRQGLFKGVSDTLFAPHDELTRAMFVTTLGRLCGVNPADYPSTSFRDVEMGQWYAPYVEWAAARGIVNGVGDGLFDPAASLTCEQMYKIVASCGRMLGLDPTVYPPLDAAQYPDAVLLDDWANDGASWCAAHRLLPDDTALRPLYTATRAESAVIIARFAKLAGL